MDDPILTPAPASEDPDAPYGRKENGEPYKTRPSLRNAVKKHHQNNKEKRAEYRRDYYQKNRYKCIQIVQRSQAKNQDKYREYQATYYHNRSLELQYFRDLFDELLSEKV